MNSFSIKRFWQTLRWVLGVNRVVLLGLFSGAAVGTFLLEMVQFYFRADQGPDTAVRGAVMMMSIGMLLCLAISVSGIFTNFTQIGSKQQRSSWLMVPATNLEKFLTLMVHVTLICPVVAFVGIALGDLLWMAVEYLGASIIEHSCTSTVLHLSTGDHTYYWWSSIVPDVIENFMPNYVNNETYQYTMGYCVMDILFQLSFFVWAHSLFTLGGTLLRKYSFVVSGVLLIGFSALLAWIIKSYDISIFNSVWKDDHYVSQEVGTGAYVFTILGFSLACLNYWLSFRIFNGFQVITSKWLNYDILKR